MTIQELKDQLKIENGYVKNSDVRATASEFANDYNWDCEWEAFNPIEACEDAFIAGIRYAIEQLDNNE